MFKDGLNDEDSEFCQVLAELAYETLSNFEILIFKNSDVSKSLLDFISLVISHKNKHISSLGIQFYGEMKETIMEIKDSMGNSLEQEYSFLLDAYIAGCQAIRIENLSFCGVTDDFETENNLSVA